MVDVRLQACRVVLVGAGHAHVEVLRSFAQSAIRGLRLTLVTRSRDTPYSGMLPGLIAGLYRRDETHIDTVPLARAAGAEVLHSEATGLDIAAQALRCLGHGCIPYDIISFDIGSSPNTRATPGADEYAIAVKPIDRFLDRFDSLRQRAALASGITKIAVVGSGAAGVELIVSVAARLRADAIKAGERVENLKFVLISGSPEILPTFPRSFRNKFRRVLAENAIEVLEDAFVTSVEPGRLLFEKRPALSADEILWVTEAAAPEWFRSTGLPLDADGFIEVEATLRARGLANVFAAGDIASFLRRGLPKSGVYAVREGPVLAKNIRNLVMERPLDDYRPQRDALYLVSTGRRHAIGARNGLSFEGHWVWRFKDWLDRRWIGRYKRFASLLDERADV
jgi:selenide, water dikinase